MDDDQPGPGWWVGSDGQWHSPDEDFNADVPKRSHPVRRVAIVLLAVAVVVATAVSSWIGAGSSSSASQGPSLATLDARVEQIVMATGAGGFGVSGVTGVACGPTISWRTGAAFRCSVYASSQHQIGVYDGTVEPTTTAGQWTWKGSWYPILRPSGAQQL
jgi:hypothetical protein